MKGSQSQVNFFAKFSLKVQTMRERKKTRDKERGNPASLSSASLEPWWKKVHASAPLTPTFPRQACGKTGLHIGVVTESPSANDRTRPDGTRAALPDRSLHPPPCSCCSSGDEFSKVCNSLLFTSLAYRREKRGFLLGKKKSKIDQGSDGKHFLELPWQLQRVSVSSSPFTGSTLLKISIIINLLNPVKQWRDFVSTLFDLYFKASGHDITAWHE